MGALASHRIAGLLENTNLGPRIPSFLPFTLYFADSNALSRSGSLIRCPDSLYRFEYLWDADFGRVKRFCDLYVEYDRIRSLPEKYQNNIPNYKKHSGFDLVLAI